MLADEARLQTVRTMGATSGLAAAGRALLGRDGRLSVTAKATPPPRPSPISVALAICDRPAATTPRSAFNPLAIAPVVLCGWSFMNARICPSTSALRSRAVARRLLARRAVARRAERDGTAGRF